MEPTQLYITLLVAGLLLFGAEIFVPGGVLGVIGGLALIGAVITGFIAFGPDGGVLSAVCILIVLGVSIVLWMQLIPKTRIGKILTLSNDSAGFKSATFSIKELRGKEGVALSPLGPSGLVKIDGKRWDALAEGSWIDKGTPVRVVNITGNHLTVRAVPASDTSAETS